MGPPSKPADRGSDPLVGSKGKTDINKLGDPLAQAGINLEEEERNLTSSNFYARQSDSNGRTTQAVVAGTGQGNGPEASGPKELSEQERLDRAQRIENYEAGRWAQNPLWDPFLNGGVLEKKLVKASQAQSVSTSREGIFYPSKNTAAQKTAVRGESGQMQIIDQGQTILDPAPGKNIADVIKMISLATRQHLAGIMEHAGRLAYERRVHSAGVVPDEWKPVALLPPNSKPAAGSTASKSVKRKCYDLYYRLLTLQAHLMKWMKNSPNQLLINWSPCSRKKPIGIRLQNRLGLRNASNGSKAKPAILALLALLALLAPIPTPRLRRRRLVGLLRLSLRNASRRRIARLLTSSITPRKSATNPTERPGWLLVLKASSPKSTDGSPVARLLPLQRD